jgi:hypothetical protein
MDRLLAILLSLFFAVSIQAQKPEYLALVKSESHLQELFNQLYSDTLSDVEPVLDSIRAVMNFTLSGPGSMDFTWNGLKRIGIVTSEDKKVRVFTWHVMDDPDHYRYFGFLQVGLKKGKIRLYELRDNGKAQRGIMKLDQSTEEWYGKLYYQVLTNRYRRKTYYTLLGMDFNDSRSTIKSVEVIAIQRNQPRFMKELFFNGRDKVDRLVLEYADQVAISVRHDPDLRMITFDHLVPFHPIYKNNYEFYGPDGSYDGLEFSGGLWTYRKDIDARNID